MRTTATQNEHYTEHESVLFMAFELSEKTGGVSIELITGTLLRSSQWIHEVHQLN